jgi:glutamate-1-semialdehyde 2,1-aminomutase
MFERAGASLAGGVGGSGRGIAFGFRPHPIYVAHAEGSHLTDVDGNVFVDYLAAWGPLVLGHRPFAVIDAVTRAMNELGSMLGVGHRLEIEAAESVVDAVPSWELVRFANTGTEAVMAALRMARGYTGRDKVLRFEGHFHGWSDLINYSTKPPLDQAGDPERPNIVPASKGMMAAAGDSLIVRQWNDPAILETTFAEHGSELAGVICEPIMANAAVIPPAPGYLELLRRLCDAHGVVLIFDEVKTGFRVGLGGAQELYGVMPDISTAAKALGAGFPIAAVGGRKDLFEPVIRGDVIHSATYHTNPVGLAACIATLKELRRPGLYPRLFSLGESLAQGLSAAAAEHGLDARAEGVGPLLQMRFTTDDVTNYREIVAANRADQYRTWWDLMFNAGILFNPHPLECWFVSGAHTERDVEETISAASRTFSEMSAYLVPA